MRHRRTRRLLGLSAVLLIMGGYASSGAAEGPYPGLPPHTGIGGWAGAVQNGITHSLKARQWLQVPMQTLAVFSAGEYGLYPPSDPRAGYNKLTNYAYFVAPAGAEHNYGVSPAFGVRTVAFGAIPVEATVQLLQRRKDGLPVPIVASHVTDKYRVAPPGRPSATHLGDTFVDDEVTLRVTRLVVDGVDLGLSKQCQTGQAGKLSLLGRGWWGSDPAVDERHPWVTGNYAPAAGGVLSGTVDVPSFTGCLTREGDDVSRLLTSAISGPDNVVELNVGPPTCGVRMPPPSTDYGPPPPGATTVEAMDCAGDFVPPLIPIP